MSKRHGATSVADYQKDYLPEAMLNFMGMLGYTYDRELLTKDEMAKEFDLAKVHKSGAVFDVKKLNWFNAQYVRLLTPHAFKVATGTPDAPDLAVPIMAERLERLSDVSQFGYFWQEPAYDAGLLFWKENSTEETREALSLCARLAGSNALTQENLDLAAREHFNGQKGSVYWPLRVALSGQKNSAGPTDIATAIGAEAVRQRIANAIEKLKS
jgi:glutamyl-tRNA synthetase